jgi:PAS domain S-box-containing protein
MAVAPDRGIAQELVDAFVRLAKGDFTVRLPRNYQRDTADTLAFFVNLIAEELDRLLAERERRHRELEASTKDLSELFLALAAGNFDVRARRSGRGDPMDVLAYLFNNTAGEIGDAFAEIDRQRRMLEAILESMLDGVLLLDAGGIIRRANGAIARMIGYTLVPGVPIGSLLAAGEQDFAASLPQLVAAGPFRDRDTVFRTADVSALSLSLSGSPQHEPDGTLSGIVLVARDDRQLKHAQAQLQMSDRLAAMGTVAAGVAHEINNPLAFVISNLDFIAEELSDAFESDQLPSREHQEELNKALSASQQGAARVRQIVHDLKTFSRVDRETISRVDVNKLLDSSAAMIRNEIRHHAQLHKQYGTVPPVEANEARLGQVFLNLVQNAAQAIPEGNVDGNHIWLLSGTEPSGEAFVEVRDTGCGIPEENLSRVFDAFFTTKPIGLGTGLGLSICHKLVTSLGGRIAVRSQVGIGSAFRVILPSAPGAATAKAKPAPVVEPEHGGRRQHLLVVDDEDEVAEAIRRILGKEHDVDVVTRGDAALALIDARSYDLVLCDLLMPDMTGMELHERLVEARPELAARMVFITGGAFSSGAREFLERVPNPRLEKPFDSQSLRELVATLERRAS